MEAEPVASLYPDSVDIPYPSGRSPLTSGTGRGQRQGAGCCRQSVPHLSGRTRQRRAPTVLRSTSQRRKLDFEHTCKGFSTHLLNPNHTKSKFLSDQSFRVLRPSSPFPIILLYSLLFLEQISRGFFNTEGYIGEASFRHFIEISVFHFG